LLLLENLQDLLVALGSLFLDLLDTFELVTLVLAEDSTFRADLLSICDAYYLQGFLVKQA